VHTSCRADNPCQLYCGQSCVVGRFSWRYLVTLVTVLFISILFTRYRLYTMCITPAYIILRYGHQPFEAEGRPNNIYT
jgi:hypothetical protein